MQAGNTNSAAHGSLVNKPTETGVIPTKELYKLLSLASSAEWKWEHNSASWVYEGCDSGGRGRAAVPHTNYYPFKQM